MADQPIFDTNPRDQYTAAASQTEFDYTFRIFRESDIAVYVDDVLMTIDTDYTVSDVGDPTGGTVTFVVARTAGQIITLQSAFKFERLTDFTQAGKLDATVLNEEQDKEIAYMQELRREIKRRPGLAIESTVDPDGLELPDPVDGRGLYWDGATGKLSNTTYNIDSFSSAATDAAASAALAQEWATKTDGLVEGIDYSAKFYAQSIGSGGGSSQEFDTFTATAAQTNFTLSNTPKAVTSLLINGNAQSGDAWNISGDDVVLTTPAAAGDSVKVDYLTSAALVTRNIGDNDDVNITSVTNGQILTYNSGTGNWENGPLGSSVALPDLSDTTITTPASGEVLFYNGSSWINQSHTINNIEDVTITSATDGQFLSYNATSGDWENVDAPEGIGGGDYAQNTYSNPNTAGAGGTLTYTGTSITKTSATSKVIVTLNAILDPSTATVDIKIRRGGSTIALFEDVKSNGSFTYIDEPSGAAGTSVGYDSQVTVVSGGVGPGSKIVITLAEI